MKIVSSTILLLGLLALTSCGKEAGTTLEVSAAFAIHGGKFDGGLIVYGESDSGKTFSMAIDDSYQKTFPLDPAKWSIYAIGWEGTGKFTGNKYCGFVKDHDNTQESTIKISVKQENCSAADFLAEVNQIKAMQFVGCTSFKKYDENTNSWSNILPGDPNTVCQDVPLSLRPELTHIRLFALDRLGLISKEVFSTPCLPFDGSVSRELPLRKFSFRVKAYRSEADCNSNSPKHLTYTFPHGLSQGMPVDFQHDVQTLSISSKRILLPTAISKRAHSPFMNLIPQILCGTSGSYTDCTPNTNDPFHVNVPWQGVQDEKQILKRNTALNSCPINPIGNSVYFNVSECEVEDGQLKAKLGTNVFTCQDSSFPITGVADMYQKAGKIFYLRYGSPDHIAVYTSTGRHIKSFPLPTSTWNAITVAQIGSSFEIYVNDGLNVIHKFVMGPDNSITSHGSRTFTPYSTINDIEVSNGNIIFATNDGILGKRQWIDNSGDVTINPDGSFSIQKIHLDGNKIFFVQNSKLRAKGWDPASGSFVGVGQTSGTLTGAIHLTTNPSASDVYVVAGSTLHVLNKTTFTGTTRSFGTSPTGFILLGSLFYIADSSNLYVKEDNGSSLVTVSQNDGECIEQLTADGKTLDVVSTKFNDQFKLFSDMWKTIGKRTPAGTSIDRDYQSYLFSGAMDSESYSGGLLRRAQEHLGSNLSTIFPRSFETCNDVKAAVNQQTLSYNKKIDDPFRGDSFTIELSATSSSTQIPNWICVDSDPAGSGCAGATFDINIDYRIIAAGAVQEKGNIQLDCDSSKGTFETLEAESSSNISRDLVLWNTGDHANARFESYEYWKKDSSESGGSLTSFQKSGNDTFKSRTIEINKRFSDIDGSAMELEGNGTDILNRKEHVNVSESTSAAAWTAFQGYPIVSEVDFTGESPGLCAPKFSPTIYVTNPGTCTFTSTWAGTNFGATPLLLKMDELDDIDQPSPAILNNFSIPLN